MSDQSDVIQALVQLWPELPDYRATPQASLEQRLFPLIRQLDEAEPQQTKALEQILHIINQVPEIRQRFLEILEQEVLRMKGSGPSYATSTRHAVVPIHYATDRRETHSLDPNERFGSARGNLTFGMAEVSIPDDHRMGHLERPRWWRLEFRESPERHVVVLRTEHADRGAFTARLKRELAEADEPDVLIFVHGYNVSFAEATRRTAQIAYDLNFGGTTILYSWPSEASFVSYMVDETNAGWTVPHFQKFLQLTLEELGARVVHIMAHSMGSRIVTEALRSLQLTQLRRGNTQLRQVVFAAPDIDAETFVAFAQECHGISERCTLYASAKDKALQLSMWFHRYARAGYALPYPLVVAGVDSIDATSVDSSLAGHSYVGDNHSILSDIYVLLQDGSPPGQRFRLKRHHQPSGFYWAFQP